MGKEIFVFILPIKIAKLITQPETSQAFAKATFNMGKKMKNEIFVHIYDGPLPYATDV